MKRFTAQPVTASSHDPIARPYSDYLIDLYESGAVGSETLVSLINYFSDDDIEDFMRSEGLLDKEE